MEINRKKERRRGMRRGGEKREGRRGKRRTAKLQRQKAMCWEEGVKPLPANPI